jgi:hypothetical protein
MHFSLRGIHTIEGLLVGDATIDDTKVNSWP